jgi:hypothetical protein
LRNVFAAFAVKGFKSWPQSAQRHRQGRKEINCGTTSHPSMIIKNMKREAR